MPEEEISQTIFPATEYLKGELLKIRTNIGNYLKKYRLIEADSEFTEMQKSWYFKEFVSELILLYLKIRPSILREKEKSEFKKLLEIDKDIMISDFSKEEKWIERHLLLERFLYKIGITRLEMDVEDMLDRGIR